MVVVKGYVRFTQAEAYAYAAAEMAYGLPVTANFFTSYFKVTKARAEQLAAFQIDFSPKELEMIHEATAIRRAVSKISHQEE